MRQLLGGAVSLKSRTLGVSVMVSRFLGSSGNSMSSCALDIRHLRIGAMISGKGRDNSLREYCRRFDALPSFRRFPASHQSSGPKTAKDPMSVRESQEVSMYVRGLFIELLVLQDKIIRTGSLQLSRLLCIYVRIPVSINMNTGSVRFIVTF